MYMYSCTRYNFVCFRCIWNGGQTLQTRVAFDHCTKEEGPRPLFLIAFGDEGTITIRGSCFRDKEYHSCFRLNKLKKGIAEFYDESSGMWENIWGEHMHHGFYDINDVVELSDHRSAQIRMIEQALLFASVPDDPVKKPRSIVDVGCGIGGSSRYLARKYGAECHGITLIPVQAGRAQALAAAQALGDKVSFQVADALDQPFPNRKFDLVWSMESGEHMPDKLKFVTELTRVAAPGATIIIVTWCHRDLSPGEISLRPDEQKILNKICSSFYLPAWCSTSDYVKLLESLSLEDIKAADWSGNVTPFWPAVIKTSLSWKGITSLLRSGWKSIRGAMVMPLMIEGFKKDTIKFSIITCKKPE